MDSFKNLDLLSVGIAIAAIGILGFIIFISNRKSVTNRTFLYFALLTILYSIFNYLPSQINDVNINLWVFRVVIFLAVWHAFYFFQLFLVFPKESIKFSKSYKFILLPITILISILNLSPIVFKSVKEASSSGQVLAIQNGPGIALFALAVIFLVFGGLIMLFKKTIKATGIEKSQFRYVTLGTLITFSLLIAFNFILPAFFDNSQFISLAPLFFLPFISLTFYAIRRYNLLNIKIITTEILTFALAIVSFIEIVFSNNFVALVFRSAIFILIFAFGILLIRSVRREVEQREKLEVLTKELQAANEKLKELDNLKSEFLSFASHQIKSPMAVVKGFAELIYEGSYGPIPDKAKEAAGRIKEAVDRLLALVKNFLDLRKIEQGKMDYNFEIVNIIDVIKRMGDDLSLLVKKKNLEYKFEAADTELKARIDVQRFTQVIQNIIDNAIKYTDSGWIKVSVKKELDMVLITVSDSGRGMSKEMLAKLFGQFSRDSEAAKAKEGTGLGLFIAKQIVVAHQGEVWAESDGEGKGSKFCVKLPLYTGQDASVKKQEVPAGK